MPQTNDLRIQKHESVDPPDIIKKEIPLTESQAVFVTESRLQIRNIINGKDDRLFAIVGPCSIHDPTAAMDYGKRLKEFASSCQSELFIAMRVYFEKPRTRLGWKGLINDPDLNNSYRINKGLRYARKLLADLSDLGLPAATEFLDMVTGQYICDLVSWGAIGARTTESQIHREMASGLSCPVGFKNNTQGHLTTAIDAIHASSQPHIFLSPTEKGQIAIYHTAGNPDSHLILRGGTHPNYDKKSVKQACQLLTEHQLPARLMIDFSHANSKKNHRQQEVVCQDVCQQIGAGNRQIMGVMIESHIHEGSQPLESKLSYGVSITDACLGWHQTIPLLESLASAVHNRRNL